MNVLYQSERMTQFKIADLQQQAIDAENIRMARGSNPNIPSRIVLRVQRALVSLKHRSPTSVRLDAPGPMPSVTSMDSLCLPGAEC